MIIVVGIWLGLFAYLFRQDARLKKLERTTENNG
jgi:CcmD family protein